MRFLELNPDLKKEFEGFEPVYLPKEHEVSFPVKSSLKKEDAIDINPGNYESIFAAYIEGDLSAREEKAVEEFAASAPKYSRDLQLMKKTRLEPDRSVVFEAKSSLKRYIIGAETESSDRGIFAGAVRRRVMYTASVAAAILLLATVTISLFPLREGFWVTFVEQGQPLSESPVGGDEGQPGAVAEAPSPLQEETAELVPREAPVIADQGEIIPGVIIRETPGLQEEGMAYDAARQNLYAHSSVMPVGRLESRRPSSVDGSRPARETFSIEPRTEFRWMAYRDRAITDDRDPGNRMERRTEVSFTDLALGQIEQRAGVDLGEFGDIIAARERIPLLEIASRGLSGLNNLLGQPVVIDGEEREDGRKVEFAIGNFIEVSRTGNRN